MTFKAPCVLRDRSKTAILLSVGRKLAHIIEHNKGQLVIRTKSISSLAQYELLDYSIIKACFLYQFHGGGISDRARAALTDIVVQEAKTAVPNKYQQSLEKLRRKTT